MKRSVPLATVECPARVRYNETDQMGVVHHSIYFIWFEMGRTEFCRQTGISYAEMERDHGLFLPLVEASCRLRRPLFYDDVIRIRSWVDECSARLIRFAYEIVREADGTVVAIGGTTHIPMSGERRRTVFPPGILALFQPLAQTPEEAGS